MLTARRSINFLFRPSQDPQRMTERAMAMCLLRSKQPSVDANVIVNALNVINPNGPAWRLAGQSDPNGPVLLAYAGHVFVLAQVDRPIPPPDILAYVASAYWWPAARQNMAAHRSHVVVSTLAVPAGLAERLALGQAVLRLAAQVLDAAGSDGVAGLWTNSGTAWPAREFVQQAAEDIPISLWLDIRLLRGSQPNVVGIATRGLRLFVGRDLVVEPTALVQPDQLAQRCTDIAIYMMRGGDLRDGDTIAGAREWQWRARHRQEGPQGGPVVELVIEALPTEQRP